MIGPLTGFADGGVFELAKTAGGYASAVTTLASFFPLQNGGSPTGSLIADSNGDIFGMNSAGGPLTGGLSFGDVFEIARTATGYAADTELATFYGPNGSSPMGGLISDAIGDLFGTTEEGGADPLYGTVFEIKRTLTGYANTPTTLVSFDGANGGSPQGSLIADANGDLFGTTPAGNGTVFEITGSGFVTGPPPDVSADILWQNANGQASIWDMGGNSLVGGGAVSPNPGPSWRAVGTGDFNKDGHSDILWQNTDGQASIWEMNGSALIGGGPVSPNPGPAWKAVGTGDFNKDGQSDILWQNTSTGQASIWEMSGDSLIGGGPVSPNPGPAWHAIGAGDFTDDGFSDDILWRNTSSGQVSIWEMNRNTITGGGPVSPNPGPAWQAIGTGDFNHDGDSDVLLQNTSSGQVSIWEMSGNTLIGGGPVSPQSGACLARNRDRRLQPRRLFRHPVSKREHRPSLDLGDEREHVNGRRAGQPESRNQLARHRNRWRRFRHPVSKHQRPSLDLGHERDQPGRRRAGQPQSWGELASRRADGIGLAYLRNGRTFSCLKQKPTL